MSTGKGERMKKFLYFCLLFFLSVNVQAQEESIRFECRGYVKSLQGLYFLDPVPSSENGLLVDHLMHNRLNTGLQIGTKWRVQAELRTRLFYGEIVRNNADFANKIDNVNNDIWDLSSVWWKGNGIIGHSMFDRLYLEYYGGDWEVRLGRQRINWGISTVWNPNDIFNAFSFTDFDYEERPGSDALRVKRYLGFLSSIEVVIKTSLDYEERTMALCYKTNIGSTDFQLLTGVFKEEWVLGLGWASNLGDAGLKGEITWFYPIIEGIKQSFAATTGVDYSFLSGLYVQVGFLYNSNGQNGKSVGQLFNFELSAKNLYPYTFAIFNQYSYSINPLLRGGLSVIYSPVKGNPLFINPGLTASIAQDWDVDLVGQIVFDEEEKYRSPLQAFFLRFKWSF